VSPGQIIYRLPRTMGSLSPLSPNVSPLPPQSSCLPHPPPRPLPLPLLRFPSLLALPFLCRSNRSNDLSVPRPPEQIRTGWIRSKVKRRLKDPSFGVRQTLAFPTRPDDVVLMLVKIGSASAGEYFDTLPALVVLAPRQDDFGVNLPTGPG
jgi:hypothetical protein